MSDVAAIRATFADWRTVKGRKQLQLIFEVPMEQQSEVLGMLGAPMPDNPMWVGIAKLNVENIKPHQERRRYESLRSAMQAGIRCNEPAFWRFLNDEICDFHAADSEEDAAGVVRGYCGVSSRSALNLDPKAAAKWQELDARYMLWLRAPQHA